MIRDDYSDGLLDKPDADDGIHCAICGRPATNRHHIVQKGAGGVSDEMERRIPKARLCGSGTTGCHGLVHAGKLHIAWDDSRGWVWLYTMRPASDRECWRDYRDDYRPMAWAETPRVIGGRK